MPAKRQHAHSNVNSGNGFRNGKPFILGICGGPSSGMITVASKVKRELQKSNISANIVSLVNFYQPIRGNLRKKRSRAGSLVEEEKKEEVMNEIQAINETVDFDDPKQIDFDLLIVSSDSVLNNLYLTICVFFQQRGLEQLQERKPFNFPVYDKFYKVRLQDEEPVSPSDVIIVEGALIFCSEQLREMFDLSLFIDTDDDVRLSRRVLKNAQKDPDQQIPLAQLLRTYEHKTKPAFERYIEPTKKYANIIIPNYGFSPDNLSLDKMTIQGVDVIITDIKSTLSRKGTL